MQACLDLFLLFLIQQEKNTPKNVDLQVTMLLKVLMSILQLVLTHSVPQCHSYLSRWLTVM